MNSNEDTEPELLNMDEVAALVVAAGVACYAEHSGGNCATLYAGDPKPDAEGDLRYSALAGPGWFERIDGKPVPICSTYELFVGLDDDGQSDAVTVAVGATAEDVARIIVAQVKERC